MANLVISAAGAAVGYMVGGPTGAQIGWMLGSAVTGKSDIDQRKVADLNVQTAAYGAPIPFLFGKQRVAGNILWADEKKQYTVKTRQVRAVGKLH